jgi:hypothetical protein
MPLLNNLKIRTKLVAAFGLILIMTVVVGLFAIQRLHGLENQTERMNALFEQFSHRAATLSHATRWAYPVFGEAQALIMYLQTDDFDEQQSLYRRFEENGKEFARIQASIKEEETGGGASGCGQTDRHPGRRRGVRAGHPRGPGRF